MPEDFKESKLWKSEFDKLEISDRIDILREIVADVATYLRNEPSSELKTELDNKVSYKDLGDMINALEADSQDNMNDLKSEIMEKFKKQKKERVQLKDFQFPFYDGTPEEFSIDAIRDLKNYVNETVKKIEDAFNKERI